MSDYIRSLHKSCYSWKIDQKDFFIVRFDLQEKQLELAEICSIFDDGRSVKMWSWVTKAEVGFTLIISVGQRRKCASRIGLIVCSRILQTIYWMHKKCVNSASAKTFCGSSLLPTAGRGLLYILDFNRSNHTFVFLPASFHTSLTSGYIRGHRRTEQNMSQT